MRFKKKDLHTTLHKYSAVYDDLRFYSYFTAGKK
jgi:hypothetical protein